MSDDSFDLEVAAAGILGDKSDVGSLLKALVAQLSEPLGDRLRVEREGGLFRKSQQIKSLRLSVGDEEFEADLKGGSVTCNVGHSSGGIRIRSERVGMDEWLRRLLRGLQSEAAHSQATRLALENMVIGGQQ